MKNLMRCGALAAVVCVLLSGCARWDSIYREQDIDKDSKVLLIDAKQRAILTSERPVSPHKTVVTTSADGKTTTTEEYVQSYRAYCAEPSPDVFTVLSQAASASGSFGQDATSVQAAAQAAIAAAEQGATIARTQTINMLREVMYRTCERYLSGALDDLQFPIQAVRDQHMMVSILAIEQLTGAVTPPVVRLSSSSSGSAGQNTSDAMVRLDDAWKTLQTANADVASKKSALETLDKPADQGGIAGATCDAIATAAAKTPPEVAETDKPKAEKCATAKTSLADAKDAQGKAQEHYDTLKSMAGTDGTASVSSSGQTDVTNAPADPNRAETVKAVAAAVSHIVDANFAQDEFTLFCIRIMQTVDSTKPVGEAPDTIARNCIDYMSQQVRNKTAKLEAETAQMQQLLNVETTSDFDLFWKKIVSGDPAVADKVKLKNVLDSVGSQWPSEADDFQSMLDDSSKANVEEIFNDLSTTLKHALAK